MRDLVEATIGQVLKETPTMKALKTTGAEEKDKELWGACCQFEAMFLQQMMSAMRKTIPESELLPRSYADSMYESMMDQAISESGSKQAPLGLALNMYRQLQNDGQATSSIQDIQQATDSIQRLDLISKPGKGGI